jgi:hypothetical protein
MNQLPVIVQTPRSRFIATQENVKQHRQLLGNAAFQRAMDTAMAEFVRATVALSGGKDLNDPGSTQAQAAVFNMISGAQQFVEVLSRLSEPYQTRPAAMEKITSLESEK